MLKLEVTAKPIIGFSRFDCFNLGNQFSFSLDILNNLIRNNEWLKISLEYSPFLNQSLISIVKNGKHHFGALLKFQNQPLLAFSFERLSIRLGQFRIFNYLKASPDIFLNHPLIIQNHLIDVVRSKSFHNTFSKLIRNLCRILNTQMFLFAVIDEKDKSFNLIKKLNPILVPIGKKWFFDRMGHTSIWSFIESIKSRKTRYLYRKILKILNSHDTEFKILTLGELNAQEIRETKKLFLMNFKKYTYMQDLDLSKLLNYLAKFHSKTNWIFHVKHKGKIVSTLLMLKNKEEIKLCLIGTHIEKKSISSFSYYHILFVGIVNWFMKTFPESKGFICGIRADQSKKQLYFRSHDAYTAILVYSKWLRLFIPFSNILISILKRKIGNRI